MFSFFEVKRSSGKRSWTGALAAVVACAFIATSCQPYAAHRPINEVTIARLSYHGWRDAEVLSNGMVEVVVVPEIGRVMQFGFLNSRGDLEEQPFWNNGALYGELADSTSRYWKNFGGDKAWPAPQTGLVRIEGRAWPPPPAFDSLPMTSIVGHFGLASQRNKSATGSIQLTSATDKYGIRVTRWITLDNHRPVMTIKTTFEKVQDGPVRVSIWVVTQLNEPERVFFVLPTKPKMPGSFVRLMGTPVGLEHEGRLLSLTRDPRIPSKIGTEALSLIWVGPDATLVLQSDCKDRQIISTGVGQPIERKQYPDKGSKAEVYTNPDPLPYVELETLCPLHTMQLGQSESQTSTYTLMHRTTTPDEEARSILDKLMRAGLPQ
jgi:hypothetical protein